MGYCVQYLQMLSLLEYSKRVIYLELLHPTGLKDLLVITRKMSPANVVFAFHSDQVGFSYPYNFREYPFTRWMYMLKYCHSIDNIERVVFEASNYLLN